MPPDIETDLFRNSLSWFKMNSDQFNSYRGNMKRAAQILRKMGNEILILEAQYLSRVLYEDAGQILVGYLDFLPFFSILELFEPAPHNE